MGVGEEVLGRFLGGWIAGDPFRATGALVLQRPIARCFVSIQGAHQGPWSFPTDASCQLLPERIRPEGARCLLNGCILQAASRSGD